MTLGEGVLIDGPASQTTVARWGDYTSLAVDPADDCTFWYTNQYQAVDGGFNWHTRIGSFTLGPCQAGPPTIFSVTLKAPVIEGGQSTTGSVLLTNVAPTGGATVALASSNIGVATVPVNVVVPAGQLTASFPITTTPVATQTPVTISASLPPGTTQSATLTAVPAPTPSSLTLNPSSVSGGNSSTATVTLTGSAPAGGAVVTLASSDTTVAAVPSTVTVLAGTQSATFAVTTPVRSAPANATISASYHGLSQTAVLAVQTTIDTTPPVASITTPANGTLAHGVLAVDVSASDNVGVTEVELLVDGAISATLFTAPYAFSLNTAGLADGSHQLQAEAFDAAGNTGLSAVVSITVDNSPPSVAITSPASGATVSGTTTVTATVSDSTDVVSTVDFLLDGTVQKTVTTSPFTWSWDTTTATAGAHTLSAAARDAAGNQGTSVNVPVTVNNTPATVTIAPVADAYVRDGTNANTNFGTATSLVVKNTTTTGNNRISFLRFPLDTVGAGVAGAKLRLFGSRPASSTLTDSAFAVSSNTWSETGITWNNRPPLGAKQGSGVVVTTTAQYFDWDVTAFVQAQKTAGASAVSFAVSMDTATGASPDTFNSREASANRPELVVTSAGGGDNPPTVATPAAANPNPVAGTTTALSVLGADDQGESNLTYTWSATGTPPAPVTFSANGTNASKNATATFAKAGSYSLQVVIMDAGGLTATSTVTVNVTQTLTQIGVSPPAATVQTGATQQFVATAMDQFGGPITPSPTFSWSVSCGGNISSSGLFTAGNTPAGPCTVTATTGTVSGTATVTVTVSSVTSLGPIADAYVRDGTSANTNFGTATTLLVKNTSTLGNNRRTFLRFDITSVPGGVSKATLRLFGNHTTGTTLDSAFAVANSTWTETGITWNNQPATGAKQGASVSITTTAMYYEFDVTAFVQSQRAAGVNLVSLAVTMDAQTNNSPDTFNSREAGSDPPQLVVTSN
jgi:hypothetical protein